MPQKLLSVIIPLYNEAKNVEPLLKELNDTLTGISYEIILVDDGSVDHTAEVIKSLNMNDVKLICLGRNYGQTIALKAGIQEATGKYIVTMDGDLQHDPGDILLLLNKIETQPWDMVSGYRAHRKDTFINRKLPSKMANFLIRNLTGVHLHDYGCSLKIFKTSLAKSLDLHGEMHRFIPVLAHLQGARITEIPVRHYPRIHGQSKYGISRTFRVVSDLILVLFFMKYWNKSMHLFGSLGIFLFSLGTGILLYLFTLKIQGIGIAEKPLLPLSILLFLAGLQFISFGLVAEILYRLFNRNEQQAEFQIRETVSFPSAKRVYTHSS